MKILGRVSVLPTMPERVKRLDELTYNLWWSWNPGAQDLYRAIDEELWEEVTHNPVRFLRRVRQERLDAVSRDPAFLDQFDRVMAQFDDYMNPAETWFSQTYPNLKGTTIAYFSAEFGLHEALPIYSGGLGVLSGDICKAASDLGLPMVGVGFLYPQGYFRQQINGDGGQEAIYEKLDFSEVPARPALDSSGQEVVVRVTLPGRDVYAKVWRIQVGRVPLFLMDTDVEPNGPADRELSARLYGGNQEVRISQEFMLGIGGVRVLRRLGIHPTVWHMNEGHSAFLGLERMRELVREAGLTVAEAQEVVAAGTVFTTHTPVAAGHDAFTFELVDKFFARYWGELGMTREAFLDLGRYDHGWGPTFSMTVLAFNLSRQYNGVSALHGRVSRRMWQGLWPEVPEEEVPIGHVTNGVHTMSWLAPELGRLFDEYLEGKWRSRLDDPALWDAIQDIPDEALWEVHQRQKRRMIAFVRQRARRQCLRQGRGPGQLKAAESLLDPDALTIGFARRFATYKRATLIFRDADRLKRILNRPGAPVQLIFAGKAHPADEPGKELIRRIHALSREPGLAGRVVFVEDHDIEVGRQLVQGVDVWLNNPRRPLEASGTSGQKASLNGVPHVSILDGWWAEGWDGNNGWAIGGGQEYGDDEAQDWADSLSLYELLEDEIVPLFYDRDEAGIPRAWLQRVKAAIRTVAPRFSARRMLKTYVQEIYIPAAAQVARLSSDDYAGARQLAHWKHVVRSRWVNVRIQAQGPQATQVTVGEPVEVTATVDLGGLTSEDVVVEIVHGQQGAGGAIQNLEVAAMECQEKRDDGMFAYRGRFIPNSSGGFVFGVRVLPYHPLLLCRHEMRLVRWA